LQSAWISDGRTLIKVVPNPKVVHGTHFAKVNQPIYLMKIQSTMLIVVCNLSMTAAAQNAGSSGTAASPAQSSGNASMIPGGQYKCNMVPGSGNQRRSIGPGLNNPDYYNPSYSTNFNGRSAYGQLTNGFSLGVVTNEFGSGAITNGFGDGGITNGFGSGVVTNGFGDSAISNGFGDYTNQGMIDGISTNYANNHVFTNRHHPHLPPFTVDPRVMGGNGLNNTND
jgi:hypothetical protein